MGCDLFNICEMGWHRGLLEALDQGADVDQADTWGMTPLMVAVQNEQVECIQTLLSEGASVDLLSQEYGTALQMALHGNGDVVKLLLDAGASVDLQSPQGFTALHTACIYGRAEILKLLLPHSQALDQADTKGNTALHFATIQDAVECVQLLLGAGADAKLKDASGSTAQDLCVGSDLQAVFYAVEERDLLRTLETTETTLRVDRRL